jgi:hypothetical protein
VEVSPFSAEPRLWLLFIVSAFFVRTFFAAGELGPLFSGNGAPDISGACVPVVKVSVGRTPSCAGAMVLALDGPAPVAPERSEERENRPAPEHAEVFVEDAAEPELIAGLKKVAGINGTVGHDRQFQDAPGAPRSRR